MLKPQDIILLCRLITCEKSRKWCQLSLAYDLHKSPSTINAALCRLHKAKLIIMTIKDIETYRDTDVKYIILDGYMDLLKYGVPYIFYDNEHVLEVVSETLGSI